MTNEELIKEALERFSIAQNYDKDQRALAIEDAKFAHSPDGQWDDQAKVAREGRPRYTINKVAGAIDQVIGDQRQSRVDIKVRPVEGGDEDTADIFNGLIRNIEAQSNASNAYDSAFDESLTGGYGGWRIITQYSDDDSFKQEIKIRPIKSAASSLYFDPSAVEYDKRDAGYAFLTLNIDIKEFKRKYPDAVVSDFDSSKFDSSLKEGWFGSNTVRVAEYWKKEPVTKKIGLLSNGMTIDLDAEKDVLDDLALQGVSVERVRSVKTHKVVMYLISGGEVLKGPMAWAGRYIPLVPEYGKVNYIEDRVYIRGIVRNAKDPSRIFNYATSASIEATALTPSDPYWLTSKMAAAHVKDFNTFKTKNQPFMFYTPDEKHPGPPARTGAPSVNGALIQQIAQAGQDIHATTGLEPASLGNVPELKSGKAILAQQAMGDRGVYVFTDNLKKSIQYTGDILVDLIPKIYDTEQAVRVLGIDGKSDNILINQQAKNPLGLPVVDEQTGRTVMVNDLAQGKYDVVIETGPAFNTQRQESAQQLIDLAQASPVFEQVATDLIAKNLNILENDELTKRVRRLMIKNGTVDPTEEESQELGLDQPQQPDPMQMALLESIMAQTDKLRADTDNKDADTAKKMAETENEFADTVNKILDAALAKEQLGIALTPIEQALVMRQGRLPQ